MLTIPRKLLALLSPAERRRLFWLLLCILLMAFLEIASIGMVLPFLAVASNPATVQSNDLLLWVYEGLAFTSTNSFLIALGLLAFLALLLSNAWMTLTLWLQARTTAALGHGLATRLLAHYAGQPYAFFLGRNSADLGKTILAEVEQLTQGVIIPALQLVTRMAVAVAILGLLIAFDPLLACLIGMVLGGAYAGIFLLVQRHLATLGRERVAANSRRFKATSELFGAIKDIKLLGREGDLLDEFESPSRRYYETTATSSIIAQLPRYLLEAVAFGGVLLIAVYLLLRGGALQDVIPVLGLYAFAGYRLMPSLQQIFAALAQLRFGGPVLDNVHRELQEGAVRAPCARGTKLHDPYPFHKALELDHATFTYPGAATAALTDVSLTIAAKTTVGFMGPTGAGKTTLIDLVLGLLHPTSGEIRVDGQPLDAQTLPAWQRSIGYVPQHIYLSDDTIARNIALGVPDQDIDLAAVRRAARIARIDAFIESDLPQAYNTVVGERGIRLSGGQRQRIGIARALYHNPSVLVFDEATSALDHATEAAVMEAIDTLSGNRTILIIAHRLSTLDVCDVVFRVERGQIAPPDASPIASAKRRSAIYDRVAT